MTQQFMRTNPQIQHRNQYLLFFLQHASLLSEKEINLLAKTNMHAGAYIWKEMGGADELILTN
jgi:hypothetical protein